MKLQFPASRGVQAGRDYFITSIPMTYLKRLMAFDTGNVLDRSQREVEVPRAKKIAAYIESAVNGSEFYVLPTLTGTVDKVNFVEVQNGVGVLEIGMDAVIHLFDGQHRATGIIDAVSRLAELQDTISVLLYPNLTLHERQQAFADINDNVKKPNKAIATVYNHRDPLAQLAVKLATTCEVFLDRVDFEKNLITGNSTYSFSIKAIKDATREMLGLKAGQAPLSEQERDALIMWDAWADALGWNMIDDLGAEQHREKYITTQGVMLNVVGIVSRIALEHYGDAELAAEAIKALDEVEERLERGFWCGRLVSAEGKTLAAKRNKYLAANLWLKLLNVPLPQYNAELEAELGGYTPPIVEIDYTPDAEPECEQNVEEPNALIMDDAEVYPWGMSKEAYTKYESKVAELMIELAVAPDLLDDVADHLEAALDAKQATNKASIRKEIVAYLDMNPVTQLTD
ncbi:TPA: DNA sulfur modification protein DndB [Vibrio fluvialis]